MPAPSSPLPVLNSDLRSSSDTKIYNALLELQRANSQSLVGLDADNMAAATAQRLGLSDSSVVRRGKSLVATSEALPAVAVGLNTQPTDAQLGSMPTPDKVSGVAVPAGALVLVEYQARGTFVATTASGTDRATSLNLFVGGVALKVDSLTTSQSQITSNSTQFGAVATAHYASIASGGVGVGALMGALIAAPTTAHVRGSASLLPIFGLAAGTYDFEVKWLRNTSCTSSGTLQDRELRVLTMAF